MQELRLPLTQTLPVSKASVKLFTTLVLQKHVFKIVESLVPEDMDSGKPPLLEYVLWLLAYSALPRQASVLFFGVLLPKAIDKSYKILCSAHTYCKIQDRFLLHSIFCNLSTPSPLWAMCSSLVNLHIFLLNGDASDFKYGISPLKKAVEVLHQTKSKFFEIKIQQDMFAVHHEIFLSLIRCFDDIKVNFAHRNN